MFNGCPDIPKEDVMDTADNKQLIQHIYAELGKGNSKPFVEAMADDVRWIMMGTTKWSRTYEGKQAVLAELLAPLRAQFAGQYTASATRLIAEGDLVVAEVRGRVTTKAGKPYNNSYCFIFRIAGGKVKEMTEYLDTQLVSAALADPALQTAPDIRA
jgi:ketosteroid isomerase-like protein